MKKYGTDPKLDKLVNSYDFEDRIKAAEQDYGLDKLINDEDWFVRKAVAEQGYGLNILINDENYYVRKAVAKQGYGLDILINDESYWVRDVVARQGYGLNKLVNDKNWVVRKAVAEQGFGLDELVYDENEEVSIIVYKYLREHNYKSVFDWAKNNNVDIDIDEWLNSKNCNKRKQVAKYGYKLDKLINDEDLEVHGAVYDYLNEHNYKSVLDWAKDNNVDIDLNEWLYSDDWINRYEVARQGYRLDMLVYDENKEVRTAVYDYLNEYKYKSIFDWAKDNNVDIDIDEWLNSDTWTKRYVVARQGYRLDKLVNDNDWLVREAVAIKGYGLDKLVNDEYCSIRIVVAKQGYGLEKLVYDENYYVREAVIDYLREHKYKSVIEWAKDNNVDIDLKDWLNSDNWCKRREVARQGYGLDILINDEDRFVCDAVDEYLAENNLTLEEWCIQNNKSPLIVQNLKYFIHKIEGSSKIKVETSYDSIDAFFEDTSNKLYEDKESITLVAIDTNVPLIKLEKNRVEDKNCFKFIVDISDKNDDFRISSIFDTKEKFDQLLQSTITALHKYSQFSNYIDELENCLL